MKRNEALITQMESFGFRVTLDTRHVTTQGSLSAMLAYLKARESLNFAIQSNRDRSNSLLNQSDPERVEFCGGTLESLMSNIAGNLDMAPFHAARDKLNRSALMRKLQTKLQALKPVRKKRFSEHDGEWDYDRRWEIQPNLQTYRTASESRVVTVKANFALSCWETAEQITRYGAMVWALSDMIEKAGVQTRVIMSIPLRNTDSAGSLRVDTEVELKRAGQYMAPSLLAAAFQSNFYRRPGFSLVVAQSDMAGLIVSGGLGMPETWSDRVKFAEGVLKLSSGISEIGEAGGVGAYVDDLEQELAKALGISA